MHPRSRIWLAVAALFTLVNFVGAWYAAFAGELYHAIAHAVVTLPAAWLTWRLARRRERAASY